MNDEDLEDYEKRLDSKLKKLKEKEKDLQMKEGRARREAGPNDNWPCAAYPIAYHNIHEEVPQKYQAPCRTLYLLCLVTMFTLPWNWLCLLALWTDDYLDDR
eukprot:UN13871